MMISKSIPREKKSTFRYKKLGLMVAGTLCLNVFFFKDAAAQGRLVITNNTVIKMNGGSTSNPVHVVVDNSNSNAVTSTGNGQIRSEGQFNILKWNVENGTGNYVVPFADGSGNLLPLTLNVTGAGSSDGAIEFSMYGTGQDNLPLPAGVTSIAHTDIPNDGQPAPPADGAKLYDRYWFINANSYSTQPSGTMDFTYNPANQSGDLIAGTTQMQAQFHNGTNWVINQMGIDDLSGGIAGVPFSDGSFFSTFTLVESGAALPITLISFNAVWQNEDQSVARVFWSTASELNNERFEIQRSKDGLNWFKIDEVAGAGTSVHTINYQILDKRPLMGVSYYRLKQVDTDGTATYSNIVSLNKDQTDPAIAVYPNPATNNFHMYFSGFETETVEVNILDNSGRSVYNFNPNIQNNSEQKIDVENFQSGVYHIQVRYENQVINKKIVITD